MNPRSIREVEKRSIPASMAARRALMLTVAQEVAPVWEELRSGVVRRHGAARRSARCWLSVRREEDEVGARCEK